MPISSSKTKGNESRRTLSSMSPSSNNATNHSLSKDFFAELVKLETEFHSQKYTIQTLDELIQHYAKAVEYYDSIQDDITSYFTFKIQDTLATRRSLGILMDKKQKVENEEKDVPGPSPTRANKANSRAKGRTVSLNTMELESMMIKETYGEESSDEEGETIKREQWQKKRENKADKSLAAMKNQRQKFVQFYHKVEVEKGNQEQDVHTVVNDFHSSVQEIDNLVQNGIEKQKERLRQKLEKKKNASLLSFSLNNSMNIGLGGDNRSMFNLNEQILKRDFLLNSNMNSNNNSVIFNDSDEIEDFDGDKQKLPMDLSDDIMLSPSNIPQGKYQKHVRCKSLFTKKEDNSSSKANLFNLLKKEEEREAQEETTFYSSTPAKSSTDDSCNNINVTPGSSSESGSKPNRLEA